MNLKLETNKVKWIWQSYLNIKILLQRKLVSLNPQRKTAIGSRRGLGLQPGEVKEAGGSTSADVTNESQV